MKTRRRNSVRLSHRSGLAMLELVLYLPIMLFVMALMVNFGNMAAWKVRSQTNTRYAGWRTLRDRSGQSDPAPANWPTPATLGASGGADLTDADALWNGSAILTTPVTRGPAITANAAGGGSATVVVPGRFEMHDDVHAGDSHVSRHLPMLPGILPGNGRYGYTQHQQILDHRWEYRHLAIPRNPYDRPNDPGDSGNGARRAKRWYRLDPPFFGQLSGALQRLAQADARLKANPTKLGLDPLDRDPEFYFYRLRRLLGFSGGNIPSPIPEDARVSVPDFHPRARRVCDVDKGRMQRAVVDPLVRQIERLPGTMGRAFESLYRSEISRLQAMMPPPQAEIDALKEKLKQVQAFLGSLPKKYR